MARHPSIMRYGQRLLSDGGTPAKTNGPAQGGAGRESSFREARYYIGFFAGAAAGFAAGAMAAFGFQNPGSALIQSSLT
jgi:hypothetical protein